MRDLVTLHAEGGILTRPHLGLIAEAGPEAVIPLNRSYRAKALALWRTAGERLAAPELSQAANRPVVQAAYATGTIATRPHVALVAERGPEAIIPLASEFRARAVALWQETGKRLGIPAFARGGLTAPVETSPRWLAPERSEADNAGGIAPSVSTQQTVSTATTINLHLGPVVDRIEIHKESDIDRVVEQVTARFSRELRLALANLAG
jgi:SLT domain-containing protein